MSMWPDVALLLFVFALGWASHCVWLGYKFGQQCMKAAVADKKAAVADEKKAVEIGVTREELGWHWCCFTLGPENTGSKRLKTHLYRSCEHIRFRNDDEVKVHRFCSDCVKKANAQDLFGLFGFVPMNRSRGRAIN